MTDNDKKSCSALLSAYFTILIEMESCISEEHVSSLGPFLEGCVRNFVTLVKHFFYVLLTVHLSIILVINQHNAPTLVL